MFKKYKKMSDSVKPIRMWIDGKCFNIKPYKKKDKISFNDDKNWQPFKNQIEYLTNDNGKLYTKFRIPSIYYIKMQNFQNFDINELSSSTETEITCPKFGTEGDLIIFGDKEENIESALNEIHSIIGQIRNQYTALQFICIPLISDEIQMNFEKFKSEILQNQSTIKGMHESIFQSALKLHLTINICVLMDDKEKAEAIQALHDYKTDILGGLVKEMGPTRIRVAGIDCMNDNYKKVDVLYANARFIDQPEKYSLQNIANGISDYFYERGLLKSYQSNVKLHATLINTKYRKLENSPKKRHQRWGKKENFDATSIMEKYKDYYFGDCDFSSIHLSLISSKGDDGFYKPITIIKLQD